MTAPPFTHRLAPDDLSNPATQLVSDREAYLGQDRFDVGRRIAHDQVELFISGDPAYALQREFELHAPEFMALHDIGTSATLRLLTSMASAAGAPVQRLSIRRQGQGVALAVLQFVEVPLADATVLRVYSTDISADNPTRLALARTLLGHSQLGVLMVGEVSAAVLDAALAPMQDALVIGPWPNRELLLLPLGSGNALAERATRLSNASLGSALAVHVTPRASKPNHAWNFIAGAWNRVHGGAGGTHAVRTELGRAVSRPAVPSPEATTEPMDLRPLPDTPPAPTAPAVAMPVPGATRWQAYANRCAAIKGVVSCCVFDLHTVQVLAHAGGAPAGPRLAQQGVLLLTGMDDAVRALGLGASLPEASINTGSHHLLLRPLRGHPGIALHLVFLAAQSNLPLAKMQLDRLDLPG